MVGAGAHRADLAEAGETESFSSHGDELTAVEHPEVRPDLDRADPEGAGLGELDQREHVTDVVGAQHAGGGNRYVGQFAEHNVSAYGLQFGVNVALGQPAAADMPLKARRQ